MVGGSWPVEAEPSTPSVLPVTDHQPQTTGHRPVSVPLFRFSTGHELWRVLSLEMLDRWKEEVFPSSRLPASDPSTQLFFFGFQEDDVDRGVFALVRDGRPIRTLLLEENSDGLLQIRLRPALPGHPEEDPTTGLQIFRWFSFRSFQEPIFPDTNKEWVSLGEGTVDWTVTFLVHDDTEIRTFLLAAMPWIFPTKRFLEWMDSSILLPDVATPGSNG